LGKIVYIGYPIGISGRTRESLKRDERDGAKNGKNGDNDNELD